MMLQSLIGVAGIFFVCWLLSEDRRAIPWRIVALGTLSALVVGFVFNYFSPLVELMLGLNRMVSALEASAQHGASFIFGYLAGGPAPFEATQPQHGFIIAFRVFPLILLVAVLSNIALHLGILGKIIEWLAVPVRKIFRISPQLALGSAASVFFGTIETPLIIKGWLKDLSRGELLALMTCSMSTIAGTVMVLYAGILGDALSGAAGHMMVASLMSVPSAIALSLVLSPFVASSTDDAAKITSPYGDLGEALSSGIQEGLMMILSITATLIVIFALVHLANSLLALIPGFSSLQDVLAIPLRPVMWSIGVPWPETQQAGSLMAQKIVLNEFVAYLQLPGVGLSARSTTIVTYALCGFANLGSLGIVVGGLGQLLPHRKKEIAVLGLKSLLAGNLATLLTGALISLVVS